MTVTCEMTVCATETDRIGSTFEDISKWHPLKYEQTLGVMELDWWGQPTDKMLKVKA